MSRTAEQGLVTPVCGGQWAQALQPLVQNSAQMARVTKAADGQAVQVHRLHKVTQQCPLQAQDVPSERREDTGERGEVMIGRVDKDGKKGKSVYEIVN